MNRRITHTSWIGAFAGRLDRPAWAPAEKALAGQRLTGSFTPCGPGERVIRRKDLAARALPDAIKLQKLPVQYESGRSVTPG
jgi:hypothetical protein